MDFKHILRLFFLAADNIKAIKKSLIIKLFIPTALTFILIGLYFYSKTSSKSETDISVKF